MKKIILVFFLLFSLPVFAETTGVINFSTRNTSVVTGLTGYTVDLCSTTSACIPAGVGLSCFIDYDSNSSGNSLGWCNSSVITSCYHDNSAYGSGTNICATNITYRTCSSGNWSAAANCSSGQTCPSAFGTPGNCTSSSSNATSSGGSGSATIYVEKNASIVFTSWPISFDVVQGNSVIKYVLVKNNGNLTLYNITLSVSGVSWYNVSPQKISQSVKNNETSFSINFSAPDNAEIKVYAVTVKAATSNASVSASKSFNISVKPSNKTVEEQIFPEYSEYLSKVDIIEASMKDLESKGADVEELKDLLLAAKRKLTEVNRSLELKDYFQAKQLLDEAKSTLDVAASKAEEIKPPEPPPQSDFTFIIIIIAVSAAAVVIVVYLLLPPKKPSGRLEKRWAQK